MHRRIVENVGLVVGRPQGLLKQAQVCTNLSALCLPHTRITSLPLSSRSCISQQPALRPQEWPAHACPW